MKVVFFAGKGKHFGSGHYHRSKFLQSFLSSEFQTEFIEIENEDQLLEKVQSLLNREIAKLNQKIDNYQVENTTKIVLHDIVIIKDCRDTSNKANSLLKHFLTVTLDDSYFPRYENSYRYIINALPALYKDGNIVDIHGLLTPHYNITLDNSLLQKYYDFMNSNTIKIVITFGMEDHNNLSYHIAESIKNTVVAQNCLFIISEKKIIEFKKTFPSLGVIASGNPDYMYILANAHCIITHFGITAFEIYYLRKAQFISTQNNVQNTLNRVDPDDETKASLLQKDLVSNKSYEMSKNTSIIFINPSRYHYLLTQKHFKEYYNFINSKTNLIKLTNILKSIIKSSEKSNKKSQLFSSKETKQPNIQQNNDFFYGHRIIKNFLLYVNSVANNTTSKLLSVDCPICGNNKQKPLKYSSDHTLFWCSKCTSIHRVDYGFSDVNLNEGKDYYFSQYKSCYGKTYEEDRNFISILNRKRIKQIQKLLDFTNSNNKKNSISVLDVGCALGYFLKDFKSEMCKYYEEIKLFGSEINSYAAEYCTTKGIFVENKPIESMELKNEMDIITFWYVIEHTTDINLVLKKCFNSLKKKGIIAFSIPSVFGPEFTGNKNNYLVKRPQDHYFDFSPKSIHLLCKNHGFTIKHIEPAAYHFERFKKYFPFVSFIGKTFYQKLCEKFLFSDTLFVYAQK